MDRYEVRTINQGDEERYALFDTHDGHYVRLRERYPDRPGVSSGSDFWLEDKSVVLDAKTKLTAALPEVKVRRRMEHERTLNRFIIVAPTKPYNQRGLVFKQTVPPWRPGVYNATEEEYARTNTAVAGYIYFSDGFWETEPDQEIFDAFCRLLKTDHETYVRWYWQHAERDPQWVEAVDLQPLVYPKGTAIFRMQEAEQDPPHHWDVTDRTPPETD